MLWFKCITFRLKINIHCSGQDTCHSLRDTPVAVIDAVNTASPVTYYVHTDHLMRPLKMTNAAGAVAWDVVWKRFGETFSITAAPKLDLGFPGQWTQSENGLAWNWRRH
ncbi:MAG: hypothetical protein HZY79_08230 [Rhodoblastus sp.]|nr:MAG: hypothetical protein HZY79_08230 [Rhodoblastus sp.]